MMCVYVMCVYVMCVYVVCVCMLGAMIIICDMNEYRRVMKNFKVRFTLAFNSFPFCFLVFPALMNV